MVSFEFATDFLATHGISSQLEFESDLHLSSLLLTLQHLPLFEVPHD